MFKHNIKQTLFCFCCTILDAIRVFIFYFLEWQINRRDNRHSVRGLDANNNSQLLSLAFLLVVIGFYGVILLFK